MVKTAEWLIQADRPGLRRVFLVRYTTSEIAAGLVADCCRGFEVSVLAKFKETDQQMGEPHVIEGMLWSEG